MIIGSGHSMGYEVPGMTALREHIVAEFDIATLSTEEQDDWRQFKPILKHKDLESALVEHQLCEPLEERLLRLVHKLFAEHDHRLFQKLISNELDLPISRLFSYYLKTTQQTLSVITTNYDRLIEFAADFGNFATYTGFSYGYARRFNSGHPWRIVAAPPQQRSIQKSIDLWKVHGSTDWYHTATGNNICTPLSVEDSTRFTPLMIYPGIRKFESAWAEPYRTVIGQTDDALRKAEAYFTVGYGFNDQHIQAKLVERIQNARIPLVCLARTLTPTAKDLLLGGRCKRFLALERDGGGTKVYSENDLAGSSVSGSYWDVAGFLKLIQ